MEYLLKVNTDNERITFSARELHEFLEIGTQYSKWFERMCDYGFNDNSDYRAISQKRLTAQGNKTTYVDHEITIDMAKEISMIQRNEKGKLARQYFIELEKEWNSPEKVIARGYVEAKKQLDNLNNKIIEMKPKVDFYDAVADSKTALPMDQVSKVLNISGIGRNKLFQILRDKEILQGNNIPYQTYVDRGYFRVVESKFNKPNGETCVSIKTLVYQKGIDFIRKTLSK